MTLPRSGLIRITNVSRRRSFFLHRDEDGEPEELAQNVVPGATVDLDMGAGERFIFLGGHAGSRAPFTILRLAVAAAAEDRTRPALAPLRKVPVVGRLASDSRETLAEVLSAPELWRLPDDDGDASIAAATDALIIATTVPGATMTTLLPALREAFGARAVVVARGNEVLVEA